MFWIGRMPSNFRVYNLWQKSLGHLSKSSILHEFNFNKTISPQPELKWPPPPSPLNNVVQWVNCFWMRKSTLYGGGRVFFQRFPLAITEMCTGVPKLLMNEWMNNLYLNTMKIVGLFHGYSRASVVIAY